jgi:DNA transformation protein
MPSDPGFVERVLELVELVGPVTARSMFGGHGVYAEGVMFGLLDDGELFLKTDAQSRARFVEAGCRQWHYVNKKVRMENTGYFRPPDEAHEDAEAMLPWARLALDAALRARAAKRARPARRPGKTAKATRAPKVAASPKPSRRRKLAAGTKPARPRRPRTR